MKRLLKTLVSLLAVVVVLVFLAGLIASIAQAVSPTAHDGITKFNAQVADVLQKIELKMKEAKFVSCRREYLTNTECLNVFSARVCAAEVLKSCDENNPNYHGKMPKRFIKKGE